MGKKRQRGAADDGETDVAVVPFAAIVIIMRDAPHVDDDEL